MLQVTMSGSTSLSEEASVSSGNRVTHDLSCLNPLFTAISHPQQQQQQLQQKVKKKRNQPGNPDPDSEVIALSPKSLMTTNRFVCEVCNKGFQRDQNLQLHRRGHNLPWKLRQKNPKEVVKKRVYVCPEPSCVHNHPSRALGDLTGIKKHYSRKHGEKKYRCDKCSKRYAVVSDWKAHSKTCGTREYKCDCGTIFSRKDSFITHRAFCDALALESAKLNITTTTFHHHHHHLLHTSQPPLLLPFPPQHQIPLPSWEPTNPNPNPNCNPFYTKPELLPFQEATTSLVGHHMDHGDGSLIEMKGGDVSTWQKENHNPLTRDFLGRAEPLSIMGFDFSTNSSSSRDRAFVGPASQPTSFLFPAWAE
ncbi:Zinc finger protein MAGPIE [Acorus calamus]|uniref:Protein EARLY HEADING DATE 2 n=1 Tax=Acorus calamus TaxID=4465 RepID=A0AAV9EAQ4_ACOCL|nr:Zinc finger protein MAGPIE [Acorus calamus]